MKKILLGFLAAATFLVGCNKNEDTPNNIPQNPNLPKKLIDKNKDGNIKEVRSYTYTRNLLTEVAITEYNNGVQTGTTKIVYSYEGNLIKEVKGAENELKYYYENGKISTVTENEMGHILTIQCTYEGNRLTNVLGTHSETVSVNGDVQSGTSHIEAQYTYSGNTVTQVMSSYTKDKNGVIINSYGVDSKTTIYTIVNDNILKIIDNENSIVCEYDNHPNPAYELDKLVGTNVYKIFDVVFSKNNITKITKTNQMTPKVEVTTFEYRYDASGRPIEIKKYIKEGDDERKLESIREFEY